MIATVAAVDFVIVTAADVVAETVTAADAVALVTTAVAVVDSAVKVAAPQPGQAQDLMQVSSMHLTWWSSAYAT